MTIPTALDLSRLPERPVGGRDPGQVLFDHVASVTNALRVSIATEGVAQASQLLDHVGLRLWWADAGYRIAVSAQDPTALSDYNRLIGVNGYELVSAGASLALRESMSVIDLAAAAVYRWEHPRKHDNQRERDLNDVRASKVEQPKLRSWVERAKQCEDVQRIKIRRDRLVHRAPARGVSVQIGGAMSAALIPPKLDGVGVDDRAFDAVQVASRCYLDLLDTVITLT